MDRRVDSDGADTEEQSVVWSDVCAGAWCLVAIPDNPEIDGDGSIKSACEALASEDADDLTIFGTRDVRYAKFAQDLGVGECALFNKFGSRIAFKEDEVSLVAKGGAFLSLSISDKLISLVGFPKNEGDSAPSITISSDSIGLTSASGKAFVAIKDGGITVSGDTVAIDAGTVTLGNSANDFVALASKVLAELTKIIVAFNTHTHAPASPPGTLIPPSGNIGSINVRCK